jgi:hypothetical protein
MEKIAPLRLAEKWDNVSFYFPRLSMHLTRVSLGWIVIGYTSFHSMSKAFF